MTPASQRQEPGDPRAKAIEAMARQAFNEAVRGSNGPWEDQDDHVRQSWLNAAARNFSAALAALEAEGWGLTCTREGERRRATISEIPVEGDGNA